MAACSASSSAASRFFLRFFFGGAAFAFSSALTAFSAAATARPYSSGNVACAAGRTSSHDAWCESASFERSQYRSLSSRCSSAISSKTRRMSLRSAALPLNGVGEAARPAALQKRRTQKKASAWNVLATGRGGGGGGRRRCCRAYSGSSSSESSAAAAAAGGAAGAKAVLRRDRISAAAFTEKVIIRMLLGSTPWEARKSARCIIVNVLPVPAPARTASSPFVASATRRCRSLRGAAGRGGAAAAAGAAASKRSSRRTSTSWPFSRGSSLEGSGAGYVGSGGGGGGGCGACGCCCRPNSCFHSAAAGCGA